MFFKDLKDIAILVDFDGTITDVDTNVRLLNIYAKDDYEKIREKRRRGEIDRMTAAKLQFNLIKMTEEEYIDFILNEFEITEGFTNFYDNVKKNDIPFAIVSGGFKNGIVPFLKKHGIDNVDIFSNKFIFNDRNIEIEYYNEEHKCRYSERTCGNCKIEHYENFKKDNEVVIFIGDGFTDKCVANVADVVFAKDTLLEYCKEKDIDCIPWDDFNDINYKIFK